MLNKESAREIIGKLTSYTKNYAIVTISNDDDRLTRFANSEIHQNVEVEDAAASITVYNGKKEATCSGNILSDEGLRELAANADEMLELAPDGEFDVMPLKHEELPETPNDTRLAEAFGITNRAKAVKKCVDTLSPDYTTAGFLSLDKEIRAIGDSNGVFMYREFDSVRFSAVVTHKDGATGYGALNTAKLDDCDIDKAFLKAYDKARAAVNPIPADIGSYTVILEPEAVAGLVGYILSGLNAASVQRGTSFAAGRIGQKVFGENINIYDDVNDPNTYQRFFDGEGSRKTPLTLIENGVLVNVLHDRKTACRAGAETTGHAMSGRGFGGAARNVIMKGGEDTLESLIKNTERGILITHFHYTNFVNPKLLQVTGLTRDGSFLIENGEISHPIVNMRFTESMINAFSNVTGMTKELYKVGYNGGTALFPAVRIEGFHFTSGQK